MNIKIASLGILSFLLWSCGKEEAPNNQPPVGVEEGSTVVLCEGNFMWGNASISLVNPSAKTIENGVYSQQNGVPLGDVAQSGISWNNQLYVVVNNSGKITAVDTEDFSHVGEISGLTSPRYLCLVNETTHLAWVSDLYGNNITEVDLRNLTVVRQIPFSGWSEKMVASSSMVFVENQTDSSLIPLSIASGDAQEVPELKGVKVLDISGVNNQLYILATDGLYRLHMEQMQWKHLASWDPSSFTFGGLAVSSNHQTVYLNGGDIYRLDLTQSGVAPQKFISAPSQGFYGMKVHPVSHELWLTDAKDYVQQGRVLVYQNDGTLLHDFTAGINPQYFIFQ